MTASTSPSADPVRRRFLSRMARVRTRWQVGQGVVGLLRVGCWALVAVALYVIVDATFGLSVDARLQTNRLLLIGLGAAAAAVFVAASTPGLRRLAGRMDQEAGLDRGPILSALELTAESAAVPDDDPFSGFLKQQAVVEGQEALGKVRWQDTLPLRALFRQSVWLIALAATLGLGMLFGGATAQTAFARILDPKEDIAPASPWEFTVDPGNPQVLYGRSVDLSVDIGGPSPDETVWLWTQTASGAPVKTACFREGERRFSQHLEQVTEPIAFWFATGRGRSLKHNVSLVLQPEIDAAEWVLTPPAYTGIAPTKGRLGSDGFKAYPGSTVELTITSNRPLQDGQLDLLPLDADAPPPIAGRSKDLHAVTFAWTVNHDADLQLRIRDVRGVWSADRPEDGLLIPQRIIHDEPPVVRIDTPASYVLATPDAELPVRGEAEDDLGLSTMHVAHNLVGYRDRLRTIPVVHSLRRQPYTGTLSLASLGVKPGNTLELYLEATDANPNGLGHGASEVVKVQVIDKDEYADMMRNRTEASELEKRFNAALKEWNQARKALEELEKAAESGDAKATEDALKKAQEALKQAAETFEKLAKDFPLYELEKSAQPMLDEMAKTLSQQAKELGQSKASDSDLAQKARDMLGKSKVAGEQLKQTAEQAAAARAGAEVMAMAKEFQEMYLQQTEIARRMERHIASSTSQSEAQLRRLAQQQKDLEKQLDDWQKKMTEKLKDLPPEAQSVAESAQEFLDALKNNDPQTPMTDASKAAEGADGAKAHEQSDLAKQRMEQVMSSCQGGFCQACKGGQPQFKVQNPMTQTLQQMLAAMQGQRPGSGAPGNGGQGSGMGRGNGGGQDDGYSMGGQSAVDMPLFGPERSRVSPPGSGTGDSLRGSDNSTGNGAPNSGTVSKGDMNFDHRESGTRPGASPEAAPPRYRDAVKKYFGEAE